MTGEELLKIYKPFNIFHSLWKYVLNEFVLVCPHNVYSQNGCSRNVYCAKLSIPMMSTVAAFKTGR